MYSPSLLLSYAESPRDRSHRGLRVGLVVHAGQGAVLADDLSEAPVPHARAPACGHPPDGRTVVLAIGAAGDAPLRAAELVHVAFAVAVPSSEVVRHAVMGVGIRARRGQ